MKKSFQIAGIAGSLVWCAAVLVRQAGIPLASAARFLVGIMPNIGAPLVCVGLFVSFFPFVCKGEAARRERYLAIAATMLLMLLSEAVHALFLGAAFDVWDLLASLIAAVPLVILNRRRDDKTPSAES